MKNLDLIGKELFNKVRGRFPSVTIGNDKGEVTNIPEQARFFDFEYKEGDTSLGKISISLDEETISVMYAQDIVEDQDSFTKEKWFNFLKEMRVFAKKRMLNFDTRNITKSNLNKRDYKFLAQQGGEQPMSESKLYGTSRVSYQDIGSARVTIKHTESINQELAAGRTQKVGAIYVENAEGERFKYPFKHLNGARAMARHVAEGGKPYDDFGTHITSLSEELANLKKFKTYMNRSSVMAEGLAGYMDVVKERIGTVKKTIESLQKENYYKEAVGSFEVPVMEEVPADVKENWIDELTIRQFNEELADVFPYIYKLVSEATRAKELGPEDLDEASQRTDEALPIVLGLLGLAGAAYAGLSLTSARRTPLGKAVKIACDDGDESACKYYKNLDLYVDANDTSTLQYIKRVYVTEPFGDFENIPESRYEEEIESSFDEMMGQFSDSVCEECGNPSWTTLGMTEEEIEEGERHGNSKIYDKCWKGYRKVPGKKAGEKGSCKKIGEGNAYAKAVRQAKMNGAKPGDEIDGPDGKKITIEDVTEYVLSLYDRETGQFPKGETAVLTAVEKDFGEQFINPAKAFIEAVNAKFEEFNGYRDPDLDMVEHDSEKTDIGNYFTKSNPEVLKKQKSFLAMTNELASREDIPKEEFIGAIQQFIKPSHDDGDYLKFASRALTRMITVMREKNDPRWREWNPIVREYQKRVLDRAIKRAYDPDQNDPRNEQNDLDNLIKTGVKGSYDFIEKTIKDFEELIKNNPNHPKVPQVKAELAKLRPQLAQARKDSGMGETTMDEDLSQNYASDAEAIQALMAKGARSNEETQYLTMLARKYDFYGKPENIPAAIEKAKKAAAKQPGGVNGQGAKMTGPDSSETYTTKDFPSMAAAMAKVDYYEPGGRITIDGKPYVRDVDEKGNKFFRPDTRKPAPAKPAPAQGQPTSRLDTKGQIPSAESVELDRIKGLAGL